MKTYILFLTFMATLVSCNDDFLEKAPINTQTESTAFKTYNNFQTYTWLMYETFSDSKLGSQGLDNGFYRSRGDQWAGFLHEKDESFQNKFGFQTYLLPTTDDGWNFDEIRRVNIMLQNIDQSPLIDAEKAHWEGVGRFFRAYNYIELLSRYGDVPWLERAAASEDDDEIVYASRTPRVTVVDNIVKDLEFAIANINNEQDGKNTINDDCARVLLSRFGLFEGTWRKYHATDESQAEFKGIDLLNKAAAESKKLLDKHPIIHSHFNGKYLESDLAGTPGIILYKEYITTLVLNNITRYERNGVNKYETHQAMVDMYLCTDGKSISQSTRYAGEKKSVYHDYRNRDHRLPLTFSAPYFSSKDAKGAKYTPPSEFKIDPMEYQDLIEEINPNEDWTRLPLTTWNGKTKLFVSPNINQIANNAGSSRSGYTFSRHWTTEDDRLFNKGFIDKPIFFMEEVMLNYAELMYELGKFDQGVADVTINPLRKRAGVADMTVTEINNDFDLKRDPNVDPILWEIRRERIVELMGEGFGFNDIRRWKTAKWFINRPFMGYYMRHSDYKDSKGNQHPTYADIILTSVGNSAAENLDEGYVYRTPDPTTVGKGWDEKYYLFPVPSKEILLNDNLTQNPGWSK